MIFKSDFDLEVIQSMGSDNMIAAAAYVSTGKKLSTDILSLDRAQKIANTIDFLMANRHGSPFEHAALTVRVNVPIFVWREWHRHRIGWSYNEESGRYKKLEPVFYVPRDSERVAHCIKDGSFNPRTPSYRYFEGLTPADNESHNDKLIKLYTDAYSLYEERLAAGMDNGLARDCLPVGIYSSCYCTCNPRSIMNFLSLRVDYEPTQDSDVQSRFPSYPLWEMHKIASQLEKVFSALWPLTYSAFLKNGRVAP